jgi:hypothetical protein
LPGTTFAEELEFVTYFPAPIANASEVDTDLLSADRVSVGSALKQTGALIPQDGELFVNKRIGIGTDAPDTGVQIEANSGGANTSPIVAITTPGAADFMSLFGGRSGNQNPFIAWKRGPLRFATATGFGGQSFSEKMRINSDGRVGIGTEVPAQRLHVKAPGNALVQVEGTDAAFLRLQASSSGLNEKYWDIISNGGNLIFRSLNDNGTLKNQPVVFSPNGDVSVGTYLDARQDVRVRGNLTIDGGFDYLGSAQWRNVKSSRSKGNVYQNRLGHPIYVSVSAGNSTAHVASTYVTLKVKGTSWVDVSSAGGDYWSYKRRVNVFGIVPPGHQYKVDIGPSNGVVAIHS